MKKILLGLVCIFSFVLHVSAYTNSYYYVKENGDYSLCSGKEPGCFDVSSNTTGLSFSQLITIVKMLKINMMNHKMVHRLCFSI